MAENFNFKKTFLIALIISLSISALIGIFIFILGDFGGTELKLLLTTLTIGGYSLTGLCCSVLYQRRRFVPLALFGIFVSVVGFVFTLLVIWEGWQITGIDDDFILQTLIIFIVLAISTAHSSLLLLIHSDKSLVKSTLCLTIFSIFVVGIMIILYFVDFLNFVAKMDGVYFRILGVFAILDALGTIVTPILSKVYSIKKE